MGLEVTERSQGKSTTGRRAARKTNDNFQREEFDEFLCVPSASNICPETSF